MARTSTGSGFPRTTGKSRRLAREQRAEHGERAPGDPIPFRRAEPSQRPRGRRRHGAGQVVAALNAAGRRSAPRPGRGIDPAPRKPLATNRRPKGRTRHTHHEPSAEQQRRAVTVPAKRDALAVALTRVGEAAGDVSRALRRSTARPEDAGRIVAARRARGA